MLVLEVVRLVLGSEQHLACFRWIFLSNLDSDYALIRFLNQVLALLADTLLDLRDSLAETRAEL